MIEIINLVKRYGNDLAVDNLTLTVEPGRIYGFLGPNGAGKSTTMNIITGYIAASSGEVSINGHNILEEPEEAKKCIGYLPEIPPLYPDMRVKEYLDFAAELKKLNRKDRRRLVDEAMEITGIFDEEDRMIRNLSKGYRQRVGLAQAILGYPPVIILDEPTVGLDPKQIIEIRQLIKELGKNHTVILSSHILSEVREICDHVFIISHGKLVASDSTDKLLSMMTGGQEISLTVKAGRKRAEELLAKLPDLERYEETDCQEEGCRSFRLFATPGKDIREKLFLAACREQCPILEMTAMTRSLEDVFLELTGSNEEETSE